MLKPIAVLALILGLLTHPLSAGAAAAPKIVLAHGALNARIAPLWIGHEQKFFAKYGVDSTVILVRQIQIMVSGLGTGEIDIALTSGSTLLGAAAGGLVAKNAFIRERQDALEGVLRGLSESVAFILSPKSKPVVLKTIMQHLRISDAATAEEGYQDLVTGLERKLSPSIEGLRNTQRLLKPRNPKLETIKVEELIDDRIVRRLEESRFISRLQATYGIK